MSTTPDPNLSATERALQSLMPSAGALNRDRLMYEAGRRANRTKAWPMATGAFAALSAILGMRLAAVPEPTPMAPAVVVKATVRPDEPPPPVVQKTLEKPTVGLVHILLYGVPDSIPAEPARLRLIDDWLRGGPADLSPPIHAGPAKPIELDDLIDPGIYRRGKL